MRGNIEKVERLYSGEYRVTFISKENPNLESLKEHEVSVQIKRYKEKRSLDANAYYWTLLTKYAEVLKLSKPYAHNHILRQYGQLETYDGKHMIVYIPNTLDAIRKADSDEYVHLKPTSQVRMGNDGEMYRAYKLLKGSSAYNTYEMAKLIEGLVSECRENDIETATPEELERMKEQWGVKFEQKDKSIAV